MSDADLVSPCIGVCILDPDTGWCRGCLRTDDEIVAWPALSFKDKLAVLERLHGRRAAAGLPTRRRPRRRRSRE